MHRVAAKCGLYVSGIWIMSLLALPAVARGEEHLVSTSSSMSTSSSLPDADDDFTCTATFKLYDPADIVSLQFAMLQFTNPSCTTLVPGTTATHDLLGIRMTGFPSEFEGPAALVMCTEIFHHDACPPQLNELPVTIYEAKGPDGELTSLPAVCPQRVQCDEWPCGRNGYFVQVACGDADGSGSIRTNDALAETCVRVPKLTGDADMCACEISGGVVRGRMRRESCSRTSMRAW